MRTALILLATLAGYIGVENLIFNTRWYPAILEPESSAGRIEMNIQHERNRPKTGPQVLTIGNSRMNLIPKYINLDPGIGYTFANIAVGGTSPRDWYYMLRDVDPGIRAYAAIAVPVENYEDPGSWELAVWEPSPPRISVRLRWSDIPSFAGSFHAPALKVRAALGVALKGWAYRADFQDLLTGADRGPLRDERLARLQQFEFIPNYHMTAYNVAGVQIDWKARTVVVPPWHQGTEKEAFETALFPSRRAARLSAIDWFGRICDLYRGSPTRIIFFRLPRGPYPAPDEYAPPRNDRSSIRALARRPGVIVDDGNYFRELEDPDLFKDPVHFNLAGTIQFSKLFADHVRDLLGAPAR